MFSEADAAAERFVEQETEFHLGALPTEQSNPLTRNLSAVIAGDVGAGITLFQQVDRALVGPLGAVCRSDGWRLLAETLAEALHTGRKICFSGCGATGRVSILLEAAYRRFLRRNPGVKLPDSVSSIMTGGDYALVRSVESFEDYTSYGRRQVRDLGLGPDDVLVAITEGGETSSVIGTAWQALENGCRVFFVCNNPLDTLAKHVRRSREIIADQRIVKLDLSTGPMAIAGSTRMQATTMEMLAVGAALELAVEANLKGWPLENADGDKYVQNFSALLDDLEQPRAVAGMSDFVALEEETYRRHGAVTYFAHNALLDIFTDTTERAPTFMLPPFRKCDDTVSPRSWAFVKNPMLGTVKAWADVYQRNPRCLEWTAADYSDMNAPSATVQSPPALDVRELHKYLIGNEADASRCATEHDLALLVAVEDEARTLTVPGSPFKQAFDQVARPFARRSGVAVGPDPPPRSLGQPTLHIPCRLPESPLQFWQHLAVKLVLNTVSSATMARMGRVTGNWMVNVETTNKKLIDRGTRLISELAGLSYHAACRELFRTNLLLRQAAMPGDERPSPVALTIERLRND